MMRRKIGTALAACGMLMMIFSFSALPAPEVASAMPALQPSPRPPIGPTPRASGTAGYAGQTGRVTGTVIDVSTGAPAANVKVNIGGDVVTSDANGNYDHWMPVGAYTVTLVLESDQGAPAQGPLPITVLPDTATVQHLNFSGPQPAAPEASAPQPAAQPVAPSVQDAAQPEKPQASQGMAPKRLPRTGAEDYGAWTWLAFGALLLLAGGYVGFGPVMSGRSAALILRAHAANSKLLSALLSAPAAPAPRRDPRLAAEQGDFLAALLDVEQERKK